MRFYIVKVLNYFRQHGRAWVFSMIVLTGVVYLPFLGSPFVFDDLPFFSGNTAAYIAESPFQLTLRWLSYTTLGWTWVFFGNEPYVYRLGNALLHAGNVILLFFLLRRLAAAVITGDEKSATVVWGAWLGALVFACHPAAVYAVGYMMQRSILMATFFSLLMLWAYMRGLLTGQRRWLVLAAAAYFMAVFSKEPSVMMPAVLAALTILLRAQNKLGRQALGLAWLAFAAIGTLIVLRSQGVFGVPYEPMAAHLFEQQGMYGGQQGAVENTHLLHLLSVFTQAGLFLKYLLLWWLPNPGWMSVDMREPFVSSLAAWQGWLGAAGFAVYGIMAFRLLLRGGDKGLAGFALLYPWLLFLVEFSTIRVQEPFVLYRSYLWMPGMVLFIPLLLDKFHGRKALLVLGCVVLLLVPLSWNRLWVFADTYRLWNDAALLLRDDHVAGADRILYNRGNAALAAHNLEDAIADLQRAAAMSPQIARIHYALGIAYFNAVRYQDAIAQFDAVIALRQEDAQSYYGQAYYGKGMSLKRLHQDEQSIRQMEKGCELKDMMACMVVAGTQGKK